MSYSMEDSVMEEESLTYPKLVKRYRFSIDVIQRLARSGIIPGGRIAGRGPWLADWDDVLYEVEGRQRPLNGPAREAAQKQPLTTSDLAKKLKLSQYTIREMLKAGELPGWHLKIPEHLKSVAGKKVCERWYVDKSRLADYRRAAVEASLRLRFGCNATQSAPHTSEGSERWGRDFSPQSSSTED